MILNRLHSAYRTHDKGVLTGKSLRPEERTNSDPGGKFVGIHAITDADNDSSRDTDDFDHPVCQIGAYGDISVDEWSHDQAEQIIFSIAAFQFAEVQAVFAVNSCTAARQGRGGLALDCCQIARMYDIGAETAQQFPEARVDCEVITRFLAESDDLNVIPLYPCPEICEVREADNGMLIMFGRHVVNQIHQTVFQTTNAEAVYDVHDKRWAMIHGSCIFGINRAATMRARQPIIAALRNQVAVCLFPWFDL
jgi:hypothetical protein